MSKRTIADNLKRVLLDDAPFTLALFDYELREHIEEYLQSKHTDHDRYFFAITEHTNDVAMLLIDEQDTVHINEDARAVLRTLWRDAYPNRGEQRSLDRSTRSPPNRRLQLTAFGARVVGVLTVFAAPRRQLKRSTLGGRPISLRAIDTNRIV